MLTYTTIWLYCSTRLKFASGAQQCDEPRCNPFRAERNRVNDDDVWAEKFHPKGSERSKHRKYSASFRHLSIFITFVIGQTSAAHGSVLSKHYEKRPLLLERKWEGARSGIYPELRIDEWEGVWTKSDFIYWFSSNNKNFFFNLTNNFFSYIFHINFFYS